METIQLLAAAKAASKTLIGIEDKQIQEILTNIAHAMLERKEEVLIANSKDLARMSTDDPKYDRLKLTESRLKDISSDMESVAQLPSPLGKLIEKRIRPNGMEIRKVSVPFGVVGVIYESRPNVTFDVFSLCLKSGNVCVLKGGSDAADSNCALVSIIHEELRRMKLPEALCTLLPPTREATSRLLEAVGTVDLLIPRGSSALIQFVRENALIPVIETGAGIVHTYFDKEGDINKGIDIITNAKTRRVSVCNALDCLIIHQDRLAVLPTLCSKLQEKEVLIYADDAAFNALNGSYPATLLQHAEAEHFGKEHLDYKLTIRTVPSIEEALEHISQYSSHHSECIISEDKAAIHVFFQQADAACVYANVSTAFTDGAQFGFGAEIGISTQKLHARGPMALPELTTYKYTIEGNGQTR